MSPTLSIDLETFSSVDITKGGLYRYVQAPDFQILLFGYAFDDAPVQLIDLAQGEVPPDDILRALMNPDITKRAYNASFEWYCLSKALGLASPEDWLHQWRCTMAHALYCGLPAGLGAVSEAIGIAEGKMSIGTSLIRTFCVPCAPSKAKGMRERTLPHHEPEKWRLFKEYCMQDVATEREVAKRLSAFPMPDEEQRLLWELDQRINLYGAAVDEQFVAGALHCSEATTTELMAEAQALTGLLNPNSTTQLKTWLEEELDEEVHNLQKSAVKDLLTTLDDGKAKRMLEIRQELAKTSVRKYTAMRETVGADGRIRGLFRYYGARTGRWTGRMVQAQNLPRNYLETLSHARECVRHKQLDLLKVIYGNVPDTLSQLLRTAFIPSPGHKFVVADFSAIEARVLAWLAGEEWRLEVFATHGKIYEASASQMFGVPLERIKKGNPEYELRQKGKVAELALGYEGGPHALLKMGALKMGLTEGELPEIVKRWRAANGQIVKFWHALKKTAVEVVRTGQPASVRHLRLALESDTRYKLTFLTITLPSGRKLYYAQPHIAVNDRGEDAVHYRGADQKTKKWGITSTYGGRWVENCLAGDTKVLSSRGWVTIDAIEATDLLWDGVEWVSHSGLVCSGVNPTISVDGVRMTADHLVLTKEGWKSASSCEGHRRFEVELPDCISLLEVGWEEVAVESEMRLRQRTNYAGLRIPEEETEVLRVSGSIKHDCRKNNTRDVKTPGVCCMACHDRPMPATYASSMGELWRTGYSRMLRVAEKLRGILARYGPHVLGRTVTGSNRCSRQLLSAELPMGGSQDAGEKQTQQHPHQDALGSNNGSRSIREVGDRHNHSSISSSSRVPLRPIVLGPGFKEPVYDIMNAGPRHRFTVRGVKGPFIVHNCTQAIARDCLAHALVQLYAAGYNTALHVHDEVVLDVPNATDEDLQRVIRIMEAPIPWAPGLLLRAEGFLAEYYMKD